jgi:hypothetical protein
LNEYLPLLRGPVRSTWALELLLLLRQRGTEGHSFDGLVRELRATPSLVRRCLEQLEAGGLIACDPGDRCRFAPASPVLAEMCAALEAAYRERPLAIINAITAAPDDRLRDFSNAFRLKPPKDESDA